MIDPARRPNHRFGFVVEQTLGHVTHYKNMRAAIDTNEAIDACWYPLNFAPRGAFETLPILRANWSARASYRAWRMLSKNGNGRGFDAVFIHTQVAALLCGRLMRQVPVVVSLDATPANYDTVGEAYGHSRSAPAIESVKMLVNRHALHGASAFITWSEWARLSLIADYGVAASRITVIPPGVNLASWAVPAARSRTGPVQILFVGGDFIRKGGDLLLNAFRAGLQGACELHLVTSAAVPETLGVHVYRDLTPNCDALRRLFLRADIFALPTRADCLPLVIQEAMAAGLAVISTNVGAMSEAVIDGETGLLIPPDDRDALRGALYALVSDAPRRDAMGKRGRALAEQCFDSTMNAHKILSIMTRIAGSYS